MRFIGVDAGGTSSRLRFVADGVIEEEYASGPANWASTNREVLTANLRALFSKRRAADGVHIGMAGVLTSEDRKTAEALIHSMGQFEIVRVSADYVPAWRACDSPGAILTISGTGSNVCARTSEGFVRAGVGGSLIADHGSGFGLGRALLNAALNLGDEAILQSAREFTGRHDCDEVVAHFYRCESPVARIAGFGSFCLTVLSSSESANAALRCEMEALAKCARTVASSVEAPKFYRVGGFWNASPLVVGYFEEALGAATHDPPMSPLDGAVLLAQELIQT